ncbi:unnamed protein product, partial [Iphiclides podalirius]
MIAVRCLLLYTPVICYRLFPQNEILLNHNSGSDIQRIYAPSIVDVPYHVLIIYDGLFCSGSLISSITVLTAASCFWKYTDDKVFVKAGTNVISNEGYIYQVESIKIHEYYKHLSDTDNDIALLLLKNHVAFNNGVKKVILLEPETALRVNTPMIVSGWSTMKLSPKYGNVLLWSEMFLIDKNECIKSYGRYMTSSNFCAKYNLERRLYDNGGPATFQDFLVGFASFTSKNHSEPYFAVFTNVSYFYRWIMLNTKYFLEKRCKENRVSGVDFLDYDYLE